MAYKAGKAGKVTFGSTPTILNVQSWKATDKVAGEQVAGTSDGGYETYQDNLRGLDVEIEAKFDGTTSPYAATPALTPGTLVHAKLYTLATDTSPTYDVPSLYIEELSVDLSVTAIVKYTIKGKSSGSFTAA